MTTFDPVSFFFGRFDPMTLNVGTCRENLSDIWVLILALSLLIISIPLAFAWVGTKRRFLLRVVFGLIAASLVLWGFWKWSPTVYSQIAKSRCEARNGVWEPISCSYECNLRTTDKGNLCLSSADCQGYCVANAGCIQNSACEGTCSAGAIKLDKRLCGVATAEGGGVAVENGRGVPACGYYT